MTNPNHTHITIVADRSGSMSAIRSDAEGAIRQFVAEQTTATGTATLLLVDFDSQEPYRVVFDGDIRDAPDYVLQPRGTTPLFDAIGRAIDGTGERLRALPEPERPGRVFFVIQTDGQENASREWSADALRRVILRQEREWSWTFVFLATGPESWASARLFAGTRMADENFVFVDLSADGYASAVSFTSDNISAARDGDVPEHFGATVDADGAVDMDTGRARSTLASGAPSGGDIVFDLDDDEIIMIDSVDIEGGDIPFDVCGGEDDSIMIDIDGAFEITSQRDEPSSTPHPPA